MRVTKRRAGRVAALALRSKPGPRPPVVAVTSMTVATTAAVPPARTAATSTWRSTPGSATRPPPTSLARSPAQELGCNVEYKDLKEEIAWQGFGTGEVDVVIENWGHDDLKKKYIEKQGTAVEVGPNGNIGIIGWYVPPWLAEAEPRRLRTGRTSTTTPTTSRQPSPATRVSCSMETRPS